MSIFTKTKDCLEDRWEGFRTRRNVGISGHKRIQGEQGYIERRARLHQKTSARAALRLACPPLPVQLCGTRLPPPSSTFPFILLAQSYLSSFPYLTITVLHCSQVHIHPTSVGGGSSSMRTYKATVGDSRPCDTLRA